MKVYAIFFGVFLAELAVLGAFLWWVVLPHLDSFIWWTGAIILISIGMSTLMCSAVLAVAATGYADRNRGQPK